MYFEKTNDMKKFLPEQNYWFNKITFLVAFPLLLILTNWPNEVYSQSCNSQNVTVEEVKFFDLNGNE